MNKDKKSNFTKLKEEWPLGALFILLIINVVGGLSVIFRSKNNESNSILAFATIALVLVTGIYIHIEVPIIYYTRSFCNGLPPRRKINTFQPQFIETLQSTG